MAAIASSTRASLPPLTHATQQPPTAQLGLDSSIAPRASFARLFRSKGSHETRLGPLRQLRSTIVPPVFAVAESRNPARRFSSSPSTSPPETADSLHSENATSLLAIPTLATVTALGALVAPSAVNAVTGADVSSVAEAAAAAAAAGAAAGTAGDGALASLSQLFLLGALSLADEPSNALSLPTWIIHVASVVECTAQRRAGGRQGNVGDASGIALSPAPHLSVTATPLHVLPLLPPRVVTMAQSNHRSVLILCSSPSPPLSSQGGGDGAGVAVRSSGEQEGVEGAGMGHGAAAHGRHVRVHVAFLL
ncbi:unnamed protein product [Closterium sp. Naga37s-1]|nr:unnamed protein product [Closterium sp. Naga37s-1]